MNNAVSGFWWLIEFAHPHTIRLVDPQTADKCGFLSRMKSFVPKPTNVGNWYRIDAKGYRLGRLASAVAYILRGKHRAEFMPGVQFGDHVIVTNAADVQVTGDKEAQHMYFRHTGYPGGGRERSLAWVRKHQPEKVIEHAIKGMLPKNPSGRMMFRGLRVYAGSDAARHIAQQPTDIELAPIRGHRPFVAVQADQGAG